MGVSQGAAGVAPPANGNPENRVNQADIPVPAQNPPQNAVVAAAPPPNNPVVDGPKLEIVHAQKPPEPFVDLWVPAHAPPVDDGPLPSSMSWPESHLCRFPPLTELQGHIYFSHHEVSRVHPVGKDVFYSHDPAIFMRLFLPHPLTGFCVGQIRVDFSAEYPHHVEGHTSPTQCHHVVSTSRYRKYFLYVAEVVELSVSLQTPAAEPVIVHLPLDSKSAAADCSLSFSLQGLGGGGGPLPNAFREFVATLPEGAHTVGVDVAFRYRNQQFAAWSGKESAKQVYHYSNMSRSEYALSPSIASGTFQLVVDDCTKRKNSRGDLAQGRRVSQPKPIVSRTDYLEGVIPQPIF